MKIFAITFILLWGFSIDSYSQKRQNNLKFNGSLEIPVGYFGSPYKTGVGVHLTDYQEIGKGESILLSVGYSSWNAKNIDINAGLLQFSLGLRQFIAGSLYLQGDVGAMKYVSDWGHSTRIGFGGGIGYLVKTKNNNGVDFSVRINRIPGRTWVGLGVGYQFKL
jgi:hypothetical protein